MSKSNILVVCSNYYADLTEQHLAHCIQLLKASNYQYHIEMVSAGTYEIPAVIQYYHQHQPFDGYIALGLLLKGSTDHYEFIWEHVKECFIRFTLEGITFGNAVISAPTRAILEARVAEGERVQEAFHAVDYLIQFKQTLNSEPVLS